MLVNLDAHFDRTLGTRAMECTVLGHEKMVEVFHNRPLNLKAQATETGAEWEQYSIQGSVRWVPPEITFSDQDDDPLGRSLSDSGISPRPVCGSDLGGNAA